MKTFNVDLGFVNLPEQVVTIFLFSSSGITKPLQLCRKSKNHISVNTQTSKGKECFMKIVLYK